MTTAATWRGLLAVGVAVVLAGIGMLVAAGLSVALGAAVPDPRLGPAAVRDPEIAWLARVLLVLAVAWVAIGMIAARTSLVRRPGAAAARVAWLASTRPWRARESTLGLLPLDRWLLLVVPAALLVATRAVQTSLTGWMHVLISLASWIVFAAVARLLVAGRSPWPVIAAVGGVVVLRCILTLAALSISGPGGYWNGLVSNPAARTAYLAVSAALLLWMFVVAAWALFAQLGVRRAVGVVLAAAGTGLAVPAVIVGLVGVRAVMGVWLDQVRMLAPDAADRLTLIAQSLPPALMWVLAGVAAAVAVVGIVLALFRPGRPFAPLRADRRGIH